MITGRITRDGTFSYAAAASSIRISDEYTAALKVRGRVAGEGAVVEGQGGITAIASNTAPSFPSKIIGDRAVVPRYSDNTADDRQPASCTLRMAISCTLLKRLALHLGTFLAPG